MYTIKSMTKNASMAFLVALSASNLSAMEKLLGEALEVHGQSLHQARDKDNQEAEQRAQERAAQLALAQKSNALMATAKAATVKNNRSPMERVLYGMFTKYNKFNANLPNEIWESIFAIAHGIPYKKLKPSTLPNIEILKISRQIIFGVTENQNTQEATFRMPSPGNFLDGCIASSPDKKLIAETEASPTVKIWDIKTGSLIRKLTAPLLRYVAVKDTQAREHKPLLRGLCWSPDGQNIAAGNENTGIIHIWDATSGTLVRTLEMKHIWSVTGLSWSPNGKYLAATSHNCGLHIRNEETGFESHHSTDSFDDASAAWSPSGNLIAIGGNRPSIFDVNTKTIIAALLHNDDTIPAISIGWSTDEEYLITISTKNYAIIWETKTWKALHVFTFEKDRPEFHPNTFKFDIAFLKDEQYKNFINGALTSDQYMLFAVLDECKKSKEDKANKAILLKALGNLQVSSHDLINVLASFHPIIIKAIIDHYHIADAQEMLDGLKTMKQVKQDIFGTNVLPKDSPVESVLAEYLIAAKTPEPKSKGTK